MPTRSPSLKPFSSSWSLPLGAAALLGLFGALAAWLSHEARVDGNPNETARSEFRSKALAALRAEDAKRLETFAWIDRSSGSVQIPIDLAMKLVLPELQSGKPRPAYPVASPQPTPPPAANRPQP